MTRAPRILLVLGAFLIPAWTTGCYVYHEADRSTLVPGQNIRVHLSTPSFEAGVTGVSLNQRVLVAGRMLEPDPDQVILVQDRGDPVHRQAFMPLSDTIRVDWSLIASLERKEISGVRTGAALVGTALLVGVAAKALFGDWTGGRTVPRVEGPETFQPRFP